LEFQRALDHGIGPNDNPRRAIRMITEVRLLHLNAAFNPRPAPHLDVAGKRAYALGHVRSVQANSTVDVRDAATHVGSLAEMDAAVHRLDVLGNARARADIDAAIHS